jgi:hypothetical protein
MELNAQRSRVANILNAGREEKMIATVAQVGCISSHVKDKNHSGANR